MPLLLDDVEARILLPLNEDDDACPPLLLGVDAEMTVALLSEDADSLKESDSCVSIVEAESNLALCVFEEEDGYCIVLVSDEAKLVESFEICDEEAFMDEESFKDNEVIVASPSAATALIIHIVVQIIVILELKSLMLFLGTNSLTHFIQCHALDQVCPVTYQKRDS